MTQGLEKDLDMIVQHLRNYWRRRESKTPEPIDVDEDYLYEDYVDEAYQLFVFRSLGLSDIQEAAADEGKGIEKVDEVEGNGKTGEEEATAVSKRQGENGKSSQTTEADDGGNK
ncbi:hypothetical protein L211DRAFT_852431 [Terfezia boudieri ATCC MYA-4762]|uniref:Uncharacterized protein n=1 Tax=Terfezia boudieri ATCC MYA-4762 TaxID=1051890 RepID=A0A3N4L519_9PEZI|nr:hypothetical protein L211DRAFT_854608 [Terfezia boudieri ATCC MYA-4762]RPB20320.1 hypothetical protein L211DRAFT_852431 [Terfezia boudieri ATCC MYA-4762]